MQNIAEAIRLKKELDSLRPISSADERRIMDKFRLDWNYHSNNLEGNTLTYGETKALILFNITAQGKPLKDHFEITGHNEAIESVIDFVKQKRPLTEMFIRELHKLCLKEPYEVDAITPDGKPTKKTIKVGEYKTTPNHVKTRTGEIFRFATPEETPAKMNDLILWYRKEIETKPLNPILLAAKFHYKYIRIHPFDDGNGRTARILMNFILMQFAYPPVIIRTEDKQNYIAALIQADTGVLTPFIEYIAKNLISSLEIMIKGAKGESIEEPDDIDKEIALLEQQLNEIGSPKIYKHKQDRMLYLYDNTVTKLLGQFIKKSTLFSKLYTNTLPSWKLFDEFDKHITQTDFFDTALIKENISYETVKIEIEYNFYKFIKPGFDEFDYYSSIVLRFNKTTYEIKSGQNKLTYKKSYKDQLTDEEINQLVSAEIRLHKAFIEKKMKEVTGKNKDN